MRAKYLISVFLYLIEWYYKLQPVFELQLHHCIELCNLYTWYYCNVDLTSSKHRKTMFMIKTLIFVEKTVCASFVLSRKNHDPSFLFRRTSRYPFFVDATTFSNKICIFSFKIRYAQCIHRNFVFYTLMGTFMPL